MSKSIDAAAAELDARDTGQLKEVPPRPGSIEAAAAQLDQEKPDLGVYKPSAPPPTGFWRGIYNTTLAPIVEHPGENIGGLIGNIVGTAAGGVEMLGGPQMTPIAAGTRALATGLGGALGQDIEDIIRTRFGGQSMTNRQALGRMFTAFMSQAAASGAGDLMHRGAQWFAQRGVPEAEQWLTQQAQRNLPTPKGATPIPAPPPVKDLGVVPDIKTSRAKAKLNAQQVAAQQKLAQIQQEVLPQPVPVKEMQITAANRARAAQSSAYRQREGIRQATRVSAKRGYEQSKYGEVINHPDNTVPEGELELKPAVENAEGEIVKPAVLNTTPWKAPVHIEPIRGELEQIVELDKANPLPATHPVKQFLNKVMNGYDYIEYDTLKKAFGRLSKFGNPTGEPRNPVQGLAMQILKKGKPMLDAAAEDYSQQAGVPVEDFMAAQEQADLDWARYSTLFRKKPAPIKAAEEVYLQERAARSGKAPKIPALPGTEYSASALRQTARAAKSAAQVGKSAEDLSETAWIDHLTTGKNSAKNLDRYLAVRGQEGTREVLRNTIDRISTTRNWSSWESMIDNGVAERLTRDNPDLINVLTDVFSKLGKLEKERGPKVTPTVVGRALRLAGTVVGHTPGAPPKVPGELERLADILDNPIHARRFNVILGQVIKRLPVVSGQSTVSGVRKVAEGEQKQPTAVAEAR